MPWGYLSCSRLTGTDFVNRLGPGCVIMELPSDSLNLDGAMPDGKPRARKTSFVPLKVGCSASLLLGQRVPGDCGAGHGAVFYRLWNAAKRRPRRAMFVAGSALMAGTWAHMLLSWVTLVNQVERDASLPPAQFTTAIDRHFWIANWGLLTDCVAMSCVVILFAWGFARGWQGKP